MAKKSANPPFATTAKSGLKKAGKGIIPDITERRQPESSFNFQPNRATLAALVASTILITVISIFFLSLGYFIIFQNLFYIPIIIACVYYTKRGFVFSIFIAGIYFFLIMLFTREFVTLLEAFIRVLIFVLIAGLITYLSLMRKRSEQALQQGYDRLENMIRERTAQLEENITDRKRAEEVLRESEEKYKILYNSSKYSLMTLAPPSWKFTSGNPKTIEMFNVKDEEQFLSLGPWQLSPEKQPDGQLSSVKAKEMIEKAMKYGSNFFEWTHRKFNGEDFPCTVLLNKVVTEKTTFLQATVMDITERKKREAELEESKTLLQAAVNIMPVGIWIFNAEGKIVTSSAAAQRIWAGVRYVGVDQLGEYKGWRADSGKLIGAHEWAGARALEKGETSIEEEVEIECFDGTHKIILDSAIPLRKSDGSIGGAVTINQDISERKRAEKEIAFKGMLLDAASDSVLVADLSGQIVYANKAAEKLRGYAGGELIGKDLHKLTAPEYAKLLDGRIAEINQKGELTYESAHYRHDGSSFPIEIHARLINISGKKLILRIGRDITERKKSEELKDQFLNTTSHELKSPLIPIRSQGQLLLSDSYGALNQKQKEAVEMILKNEDHLERLVSDVLDIASAKSSTLQLIFEEADIGAIVHDSVENLVETAKKKGIILTLEPVPELPPISIDSKRISQVITNLLNNSIKYMPEEGGAGTVSVAVHKTKDDIGVSVHDTGIGMDKETLEKIFTPFFQTDRKLSRKYGGVGLGLSVCKGIIEAHGGNIWGTSEGKNRGSTFTFTLPLTPKNL